MRKYAEQACIDLQLNETICIHLQVIECYKLGNLSNMFKIYFIISLD